MSSYNLFRSRERSELICAVPEDRAVPRFITGTEWEFDCKLEGLAGLSTAFNLAAAEVGVHYNGFYLFQRFPRPRQDPVRSGQPDPRLCRELSGSHTVG